MKIRLVGAELFHVDRRTDMTKLIVAFRNFAPSPKNLWICRYIFFSFNFFCNLTRCPLGDFDMISITKFLKSNISYINPQTQAPHPNPHTHKEKFWIRLWCDSCQNWKIEGKSGIKICHSHDRSNAYSKHDIIQMRQPDFSEIPWLFQESSTSRQKQHWSRKC